MAVARITRIRRIGDYRAFHSWGDSGASPFVRVNLIYGTNGSGKSTLANLLQDCCGQEVPVGLGLQLDVEENGKSSVVTESTPEFWNRVLVFNRSYVENNLRFDDEGGPSPDSLLTLGKVNVANEEELARKRERREKAREELREARSERTGADTQAQKRLSAVAKTIAEELQPSRLQRFRGTNVYTKAEVRARLEGDRAVLAKASEDVPADIARATAAAMPEFNLDARATLPEDDAVRGSREMLGAEIVVQVLEELRGDGDRAAWVQDGIALHEGLDRCLFCGERLSAARRHALTAHFDDALRSLQKRIDGEIVRIESAVVESKAYLDRFPVPRDVYSDLADGLAAARLAYETEHRAYAATVGRLVVLLRKKRGNPFQSPELGTDLHLDAPECGAIEQIVATHKSRVQAHATEVAEAATRVELARLAEFADEYDAAAKTLDQKVKLVADREDELRVLDSRIATLENVSADPVPKADELTENVTRLLGRAELAFRTAEDGLHYLIERDRKPATHLSEGERTAIALLHFLTSVREDVMTGDEPILVIDDPVSSLDHEILFGASAFIWAGLVPAQHVGQFFLLTHNFELFRQWIVQLERVKKAEVPGGFTIHELRMRYLLESDGVVRRVPRLEPWNSKLSNKLRSQYHFWFSRVAQTLVAATPDLGLAERMELLALAPNAARRMMEGFLSFRFPEHIGNFHGGMGAALEKVNDEALRNRVERYLHAYSHNDEGDISAMLDPSEATTVFRALFELMKAVDANHLSGMCAALALDENQLLTAVASPVTP